MNTTLWSAGNVTFRFSGLPRGGQHAAPRRAANAPSSRASCILGEKMLFFFVVVDIHAQLCLSRSFALVFGCVEKQLPGGCKVGYSLALFQAMAKVSRAAGLMRPAGARTRAWKSAYASVHVSLVAQFLYILCLIRFMQLFFFSFRSTEVADMLASVFRKAVLGNWLKGSARKRVYRLLRKREEFCWTSKFTRMKVSVPFLDTFLFDILVFNEFFGHILKYSFCRCGCCLEVDES